MSVGCGCKPCEERATVGVAPSGCLDGPKWSCPRCGSPAWGAAYGRRHCHSLTYIPGMTGPLAEAARRGIGGCGYSEPYPAPQVAGVTDYLAEKAASPVFKELGLVLLLTSPAWLTMLLTSGSGRR